MARPNLTQIDTPLATKGRDSRLRPLIPIGQLSPDRVQGAHLRRQRNAPSTLRQRGRELQPVRQVAGVAPRQVAGGRRLRTRVPVGTTLLLGVGASADKQANRPAWALSPICNRERSRSMRVRRQLPAATALTMVLAGGAALPAAASAQEEEPGEPLARSLRDERDHRAADRGVIATDGEHSRDAIEPRDRNATA